MVGGLAPDVINGLQEIQPVEELMKRRKTSQTRMENVARAIGSTIGVAVRTAGEVVDDLAMAARRASSKLPKRKAQKKAVTRAKKAVGTGVKRVRRAAKRAVRAAKPARRRRSA